MENRKIIENVLACPVCSCSLILTEDGKSAACTGVRRHLFDFASAGYLNLYASRASGGDGGECVGARTAFLSKGYYEKISDSVNALLGKYTSDDAYVLDAGCGEGYYTNRMAKGTNRKVFGFDLAKPAINTAAKSAKREGDGNAFFGVASAYSLPVISGSMNAVTTIFAPCAEEEYARVLADGGILLLVGAAEEHLIDLKRAVYDSVYKNEGRRDLPSELFELLEEQRLTYTIELPTNADIQNLFAMTPYYYHTSAKDKEKLASLSSLCTKVDVELFIYKKK